MWQKKQHVFRQIAKQGIFPHELAFTLLIPLRNIFLSPQKLIQRLGLKADYNVLEIGCGPGYFSPRVARAIPEGQLVLADIQEQMLALAQKRLSRKGIFNVEYHLCNGVDFPFTDERFDVVYMVTVLGEVENKQQYCKEINRMLRLGGIFSISEQGGDPDKMSIDEIKGLLSHTGFKIAGLYGSENNFTINFLKNT